VTATNADGDEIESTTGVNSVHLTIPANSTYPVTVEASGDAGTISTILTNDVLPIRFAVADGDNGIFSNSRERIYWKANSFRVLKAQTFQYLLEFDFCSTNLELKRDDGDDTCTDGF